MSRRTVARLRVLPPDEAINRIHEACDQLVERVTEDHDPPVTCRAGCSFCCRQPVFITPFEGVAIRDFVERSGRTEEVRQRVRDYLRAAMARPGAEAGLRALRRSVTGEGPEPAPEQRRAVYGTDCVFLEDGICSIYPVRPLMCREHISFDAVERCERDEPFLGLDKPRFEQVPEYLARTLPPHERIVPVWEFERAAESAGRLPPVDAAELRKILLWKAGK